MAEVVSGSYRLARKVFKEQGVKHSLLYLLISHLHLEVSAVFTENTFSQCYQNVYSNTIKYVYEKKDFFINEEKLGFVSTPSHLTSNIYSAKPK